MILTEEELFRAIEYAKFAAIQGKEKKPFTFKGDLQMVLYYYFTSISPLWTSPFNYDFHPNFTLDELIEVFKGSVLIERLHSGNDTLMGSVSAVDKIYGVIAEKNYKITKYLKEWMAEVGVLEYFEKHLVDDNTEAHLTSKFATNKLV